MRSTWILAAVALLVTACGSGTSPYGSGGDGSSGGGGGAGGGAVGQVVVGNNLFRSAHNGSQNPAVDTIAAGDSITWRWNAAGSHSIESTGAAPAVFPSSAIKSGGHDSVTVKFGTPGRYPYECAVHGAAMSGVVVVR